MLVKPPTIVIRHPREKLSKCSLHGLEDRADMNFVRFEREQPPSLEKYLRLSFEGPPLTPGDGDRGLLLLDGTWRLVEKMERGWSESLNPTEPRSLPGAWVTAYPRRQTACPEPNRGLASVEALFAAYCGMGRSTEGLLAHYRWADRFLELNRGVIEAVKTS